MSYKTLYIIGNGFDLHHGLKTGYKDFASFLKNKDSNLYSLLEENISFPEFDSDLWRKLEENLANLDVGQILDDNTIHLPDIASDEFRDRDLHAFPYVMENICENLTIGLVNGFQEFICQVEQPASAELYKLFLDKNASFLSFNYTSTLERLYGIRRENILYIHNNAFEGYEAIVLGHGIDPEQFKEQKPNPPDDLDEKDLERWYQENDNWDYSYDTGKENLMRYFLQTYKPTDDIIKQHAQFFSSLYSLERIFVFGHGLGPVDLPYFKKIIQNTGKQVNWIVSYLGDKEKESHMVTLQQLGVEKNKIEMIELVDLQVANNQMKLNFTE